MHHNTLVRYSIEPHRTARQAWKRTTQYCKNCR